MGKRAKGQNCSNGSSAGPEGSPLPVGPTGSAFHPCSRSPSPSSTDSPTLLDINRAVAPSPQPPPEEDEVIFYDALDSLFDLDEPVSRRPTQPPTLGCQGVGNDTTPEGTTAEASTAVASIPFLPFKSPNHSLHTPPAPPRGAAVPAAAPSVPSAVPRLVDRVERDFLPQAPAVVSVSRGPTRKAVVTGANHAHSAKLPPLRYANRDATCFAHSLEKRGFSNNNIILLTDEADREDQRSTYSHLMKWIDWLVGDAVAGDTLVFFFSGHSVRNSLFGPSLFTADEELIPRYSLHDRLVGRIPANCELYIILDCCYASAMIHLQYCIGRMMVKPEDVLSPQCSFAGQVAVSTSVPESDSLVADVPTPDLAPTPPATFPQHGAFNGSLSGLSAADDSGPPPTPAMPESDPPAPSNNTTPPRRTGGSSVIAVAPSPLSPDGNSHTTGTKTAWTKAGDYIASLVGTNQAPMPSAIPTEVSTNWDLQRGRHRVVAGVRSPDYFEVRRGNFVKPAGRVMFWAGTGENQRAFEAYGSQVKGGVKIRVENGIVAHVMCTLLDAHINTKLAVRDTWNSLVSAIDEENGWRNERDAAKSPPPDPNDRVQHAELWISQPEPLLHAAPVLDRLML